MVICDKCDFFVLLYVYIILPWNILVLSLPYLCFSFLICSISVSRSPGPHLSSIRSKREKEVAKKAGPEILKPFAQQIKIREIGSM